MLVELKNENNRIDFTNDLCHSGYMRRKTDYKIYRQERLGLGSSPNRTGTSKVAMSTHLNGTIYALSRVAGLGLGGKDE